MKFVYTTDLHGDIKKYECVLDFATSENISIIHLGADLLPKGQKIFEKQKSFVKIYLKDFHERCHKLGITVLSFFGNDDIYTVKDNYRKYADLLDEKEVKFEEYIFKAYPYVCDYPFALKTACKLDYRGWIRPFCNYAVDVGKNAFYEILEIDAYLNSKTSIEEDLKIITADQKTIMSFHMPPCSLDLDVCLDGRRVGSKAILEWIEKNNHVPLILSGHIHESYLKTKVWKAQIGKTIIIQPGQLQDKTTLVYIESNKDKIESFLINK